MLLDTLDRSTGKAVCQSLDFTRGIITGIAGLGMSNSSSRRDFAVSGKQWKRVIGLLHDFAARSFFAVDLSHRDRA